MRVPGGARAKENECIFQGIRKKALRMEHGRYEVRGTVMVNLAYRAQDSFENLDGFHVELVEVDLRADIVLDRPPFNTISALQCDQLCTVFEALDADPLVRVIVVRSEGEHFSSGSEVTEMTGESATHALRSGGNMNAPSRCSKPVIAANRGYCFGVGFELALACDFRIATETTLYALPSPKVGQMSDSGGSARLLMTVGLGRTKDIVMRSRYIRGPQAYEWGIATEFVVDSELENATNALVRELLAFSPHAQRAAKKLLNEMGDVPLPFAMEPDQRKVGGHRCPDDFGEGVQPFPARAIHSRLR
jgi:2-oxoglutaroyl-CoA hydrolase